MKKTLIALSFFSFLSVSLISCGPDEPAPNVHKLVEDWGGGGTVIRCCYGTGNQCSRIYWETLRSPSFRSIVDNDQIGRYFAEDNWQSAFPELVGRTDVVSEIIARNPKGVFNGEGEDQSLVLLKDAKAGLREGNILFAFVQRVSQDPCEGYPGN